MDTGPSVSTSKHRHGPVTYIGTQIQSFRSKFKATLFIIPSKRSQLHCTRIMS